MPQSRPNLDQAFASLLDARARRSGSGPSAHPKPSYRPASVRGIDVAAGTQADLPVDMADALRRAYAEEEPSDPTPPRACDPAAVARELGLAGKLTAREIERIRRRFALTNHPDRVPASQRDLATRRMTVANMLVDQALAACRHNRPR